MQILFENQIMQTTFTVLRVQQGRRDIQTQCLY